MERSKIKDYLSQLTVCIPLNYVSDHDCEQMVVGYAVSF